MKKILSLALLVALAVALLTGCQPASVSGYATVVVGGTEEIKVNLDEVEITNGVLSVLEYLENKGELDFEAEGGDFGAYLTKVGSIEQNFAEGKYVGVWTSNESDFDVTAYAQTKTYKGVTLTTSGVGVSSMSVKDGVIIYFDYISYD